MKKIFKSKLILLLIFIVVIIIILKIFGNKEKLINKNSTEFNKINNIDKIINIPTLIPKPTLIKIRGLTPEEINNLKAEEYDIFVDSLNEEEWKYLIPLKYELDLPYEENSFYVEKYENNNLTVKLKVEDKRKAEEDLYGWLYFNKGRDPKDINIIWK